MEVDDAGPVKLEIVPKTELLQTKAESSGAASKPGTHSLRGTARAPLGKAVKYEFDLDFFSKERCNAYAKYLVEAYEAAAPHYLETHGEAYKMPSAPWFKWVAQEALVCAAAAITRFGMMVPIEETMFMQSDAGCIFCGKGWTDLEQNQKATERVCQQEHGTCRNSQGVG